MQDFATKKRNCIIKRLDLQKRQKPAIVGDMSLDKYGLCVPEILLPREVRLDKWSVIACDQYTTSQEYWDNVASYVKGYPSTLDLVLPEIYLERPDTKERIEIIHENMKNFMKQGVWQEPFSGLIRVKRYLANGKTRMGLVVAVDLDSYDYHKDTNAKIRATEATIEARLPARCEIRLGASVELPHIMLLLNDKKNKLQNALEQATAGTQPLYEGDLMLQAGGIVGYGVKKDKIPIIEDAFEKLWLSCNTKNACGFMLCVGDGNHSLAAAKNVWEEYKKTLPENCDTKKEKLRYALVEIVNLYDKGLEFLPIHRVVFGGDFTKICTILQATTGGQFEDMKDEKEFNKKIHIVDIEKYCVGLAFKSESGIKWKILRTPIESLLVCEVQKALDEYMETAQNLGAKLDYVHGESELARLVKMGNVVGIHLPKIQKNGFFDTIKKHGALPRKSFSMGQAEEKRFYLEARALV